MKRDENYIITIDGKQTMNGVSDSLTLLTLGSFSERGGKYYIGYAESEATGFEGDYTTVKVEDDFRVTMQRTGKTQSQLIIEKGQKHLCHYDTEFGDLMIGIRAESIVNSLHKNGGRLRFRYSLDVDANELSVNEMEITVKERTNDV